MSGLFVVGGHEVAWLGTSAVAGRKKPFRLMSFIHDSDDGEVMFWDFKTLQEAKDYAEMI